MKTTKLIGLGAAVIVAGAAMVWWYQDQQIHPKTDDAYLQANILSIAPQVSGRIVSVGAQENVKANKGDVLFQIDPAPLLAALDTAQAAYDQAVLTASATNTNVPAAQERVTGARAAQSAAQTDFDRQKALVEKGAVAQAVLDTALNTLDQANAAVAEAEAVLKAARDLAGAPGGENATVRGALGQLTQARLALGYATVTAPVDGWVANISLRPGQVVAAGQPLFSLVEDDKWWVEGNFKETDLVRIRPGQPVSISVDMYPGTTLEGVVDSIGAGSGAVFSLLPAQNATGNWVKVTQRFPVRIALGGPPADPAVQLRVGASVTATVDTSGLDKK